MSSSEVYQKAFTELGATGLKRFGGYVEEEFLTQLRGPKAVEVYKEMSSNDAVIGSILFAIDMLIREAEWRVDPASDSYEDQKAAWFVESCMEDMSHTWEEFVSEVLSMLTYGWAWHETVYKRRLGDLKNPRFRSKYEDGYIGWRKIPIRAQDTLHEWVFDSDGGIQAMKQMAPPDYQMTEIPIEKSLLFRTTTRRNSPEGYSVLRNAYRSWYFLKRFQEIEGIGIERDLAGLPVAKIPAEMLHPNADEDDKKVAEGFKQMVRNVRRDEQEGVVMPSEFDQDTGNELYSFELLSSGGSRQIDVNEVVTRYEQRMAMTVLADFILLGHDKTGSYSLSLDKTGLFRTALNAWTSAITSVINRHEIPRLFGLNGWELTDYPKITAGEIDPPDIGDLGTFLKEITGAGMQLFPDPELENFIRDAAKLPEKDPQVEMAQQQQQAQMQAQQAAQQVAMDQQRHDEPSSNGKREGGEPETMSLF